MTVTELLSPPSLADRICAKEGITQEVAVNRLFWKSIALWRRPLVWLLRLRDPRIFAHDLQVVRDACAMTRQSQFDDIADGLHHRRPDCGRFVRRTLGFRISANRLMIVAKKYFGSEG